MRQHNNFFVSLLVLLFSSPLAPSAVADGNDPRLEKIFQDWEQRQQAIRSARYRVVGERIFPKGSANDILFSPSKEPYPPHDITCAIRWTLLVDFSTGRYRLDIDQQDYVFDIKGSPGKWNRVVGTTLYDGTVVKHVAPPREPNTKPAEDSSSPEPDITIEEGDLKNEAFMSFYWPFFVGHGIISYMYHEIAPKTLRDKPDIELFTIHGQGVHQGRPCLVLRSHPSRRDATIDEFWIDSARDSAILRQLQISVNGKPITESDIQYQQTTHGWLPKSWVYTIRNPGNGKTVRLERMHVSELELDCPVSGKEFTAEERPGMFIVRKKFGKPIASIQPRVLETNENFYRVNDSGSRVEVVIDNGVEHRRWARLWWLLGLTPVAVFAGWFFYRRRTLHRIALSKGENRAT